MKQPLKHILKIAVCCVTLGLLAFIPRDEDPLGKLVTTLQRWTDSIPQEKVYLHMDKPYYALGDTIWFKGYVTIGARHQLSALSGAVYVELINERDSLLQQLKLPVTAGMVMGNFILNDDFQQGNYRIRAYTQWMRNAGEQYFFDRTFLVGDGGGSIIANANFSYKDNNGKPELSALLNYTNDAGSAIGEKGLRFEIRQGKKIFWQQNAKTDALGSLKIIIPDDVLKNPAGAYIHTILQANAKYPTIRDFPIKAGLSQSDVQFFPESGGLVNGLSSHVAFKAIGTDGLGVNLKGTVVDNENKEVAKIQTLHAGMGSFLLTPVPGKTYTANITFDDGSTKTVPLPAATDQGFVLSVYQPNKDSVLVRILAGASSLQSTVSLIAHTGGEVEFSSPIKIEKPITSIWLDKKTFPGGIAQFTLFNNAGEPLNERLAFIRGNDRLLLDVSAAKASFDSKERVQLSLNAKSSKGQPTPGNFSVAIIDESKVPVDENKEHTIFSDLLLTSDLKGYVEQPNYYFATETEETDKALDNLMLTQGYRRFAWKELGAKGNAKPKFPAEELGSVISGMVTTLGHKPLANASVMLTSIKARVTKLTTTDSLGRFKFDKLFITDSIKITVQARNGKSDKVITLMDTLPHIRINPNPNWPELSTNIHNSLKAYMKTLKQEDDIYEKMGALDKMHRLREVRIHARKPTPPPYKDQGPYHIPEGIADQTYMIPEGANYASLGLALMGQLKGVIYKAMVTPDAVVINYPYGLYFPPVGPPAYVPLQVMLDGRKLSLTEIADVMDGDAVQPEGVAKIDVVRSNNGLMSYLKGPTLLIYTKRDYVWHRYNPSVVNFTPKGFNKVREFYMPRYDRPGKAGNEPDLRTTIYWNPYLKTDTSGKTTFSFFNADGPGTYRVVVEGINADGELGRQVFRYTVDGARAAVNTTDIKPADKNLQKITAPLDSFNRRMPMEKVYLHTDRPYYNIGDTLWFKSYLVDGHNLTPSKISGLLYVELDNDSAEMVRRISVPVKDGMAAGQIPLSNIIFHQGGYTLRAYTNWMQNFGEGNVFSQRFYLGVPAENTWLVKSNATISRVENNDQLQVDLKLTKADNLLSPVAWRKLEVKIYDEWHYISKQELQTGGDGSLKFSHILKDKADGRRVRIQLTSLEPADNNLVLQVPLLLNRNQNIDLKFLPEGGKLVAGLKSTVGFKAVSEDGHGIVVTGGIFDGNGNQVLSFMPLHNGMGSFEFTPKTGETYTARIDQPVTKTFALPKIESTGTVMHISNVEKSDSLKIELANTEALVADSSNYLIGMSKGTIYYAEKIDSKRRRLSVPKKLFPSGVARFTLFCGSSPLNERAVFIDNQDQLRINIHPNKSNYLKRDSVGLELEVKDKDGYPVQGNFSLAVTDDSQVKPDSVENNSIAAYLMLRSELKGNIESPGYYTNRQVKSAWQALDNLMLTQGWTNYDWKDIFAPAQALKYRPETEFKVTGRVTNLFNKPVNGQTVLISSQKPGFITTTTTGKDGRYEFKNLPTIDTGSFFLQAKNDKGKNMAFGNISVEKFKAMPVPDKLESPILPWYVNTDTIQLNYVKRKAALARQDNLKLTGRVLKEVQIKGKKIIPDSHSKNGPGNSDLVFDEQDIKKSETTNLYELLQQKLPGLHMGYYRGFPALTLSRHLVVVLIDGIGLPLQLDIPYNIDDLKEEISKFKITSFKGMEVNYSEKGTFRYLQPRNTWIIKHFTAMEVQLSEDAFVKDEPSADWLVINSLKPGYLERLANLKANVAPDIVFVDITTKNGAGWFVNRAPSVVTYRPLPVSYPKQFYSPKYNVVPKVNELDYRATVFWEPDITTDQNGKAKVSFYTTDIQSKYTVKVAGIDGNGNLGDGTLKINQPKPNETSAQTHP